MLFLRPIALTVLAMSFTCSCALGAEFDNVLAVPVEKGLRGPRGMPGDFVQLADGTIVMAYTKDGSIVAKKSKDKGKSWGQEYTLVPKPAPPAKGRVCHPSFLRLKNGEILLSYIYSTHPLTPYFGHNYVRRSADEGKTWTEQFCATPYPGYVIAHNDRLLTLSTGRILLAAEYKAHWPSSRDHSGYVGICFYSDTQGHTWQVSKNTVDMKPVEVQEADVVELKDGRIMMFARTYSGYPVRSYSKDGGETWSKGEPMKELKMPYAGLPTVKRIPSTGDLLFIWISEKSQDKQNPKIRRRCALSSCISKDEGKTFIHKRHIVRDPEDDFGYQAVEFLEGDITLVCYHARDGLHVARIPVGWFYEK